MTTIRIPAEELELREELDLLVVGGGSAGVAAAVSGARLGLAPPPREPQRRRCVEVRE